MMKSNTKGVRVRFDLGSATLSAEAARRLDVGSVICLDAAADAPVTVYVDATAAAVGSPMTAPVHEGKPRLAVSVNEVVRASRGSFMATATSNVARVVLVLAAVLALSTSAWAQTANKAANKLKTTTTQSSASLEDEPLNRDKSKDANTNNKGVLDLGWSDILQTLLALAVVIVLIFLTRWVLRRMGPRRLTGGSDVMQVLASAPIGGRGQMILVKLGTRLVLVGMIGQTMTTLTEVTDPAEAAALASAAEQHGADSLKNIFRKSNKGRSPLGQVAQQIKSKLENKQES